MHTTYCSIKKSKPFELKKPCHSFTIYGNIQHRTHSRYYIFPVAWGWLNLKIELAMVCIGRNLKSTYNGTIKRNKTKNKPIFSSVFFFIIFFLFFRGGMRNCCLCQSGNWDMIKSLQDTLRTANLRVKL